METSPEVQERVDGYLARAKISTAISSEQDQETTDRIVEAVFKAALNARVSLAKMAVEETQLGVMEHKVIKNVVAAQVVYNDIKHMKTAGVIECSPDEGVIKVAHPLGPILAVTPMTNPTSTVIFKILISLKARNPIIISPHRRAIRCSIEAARICYEAALQAGAPDDCIQWITESSREQTHALMSHPDTAMILATGGMSLVRSAYSSGTPTIGVGAGNVPICVTESADIPFAVQSILASKTFDNGTVCASEQSIVAHTSIAAEMVAEFKRQNAYVLSDEEQERLIPVLYNIERGVMNADIVGQPAVKIAEMAGIDVPPETVLLLGMPKGVGPAYPLSAEILAPALAFYEAKSFDEALNICLDINYFDGTGHTAGIYSNNDAEIVEFASCMNAGRVVVNVPSSQGGVGGISTALHPSFTLGCGSGGNNITSDNVTATHLLNIQRIARKRVNFQFAQVADSGKYLDESIDADALEFEYHKNQ